MCERTRAGCTHIGVLAELIVGFFLRFLGDGTAVRQGHQALLSRVTRSLYSNGECKRLLCRQQATGGGGSTAAAAAPAGARGDASCSHNTLISCRFL